MKALVKAHKKRGLWLQDVEKPKPGGLDVLVKIEKTAICGTDLHIHAWNEWAQRTIPVPMHVGHEFYGKVVECGKYVRGLEVGDRVSGEGHITCGTCRNCRAGIQHLCPNTVGIGVNRPGAFAEYLCIPATNVFKLPSFISDEVAALLDPLGNAVHTALSFNSVGEDVLVTGAGPIGIMGAMIAKHIGARYVVITDRNPYRINLAQMVGIDNAINIDAVTPREMMKHLEMKEGYDIGLEMSGNAQALKDMIGVMNNGGRVALLGLFDKEITVNWNDMIFKGLKIKCIYGREMFETWYKMETLIQTGLDVTPIITHRFHYTEFDEAFEIGQSGQSGKIILSWV